MKALHKIMYGLTALVQAAVSLAAVSACRPTEAAEPLQEEDYAVSLSIPVRKSADGDTDVQSAAIYAFNVGTGNLTGYIFTDVLPSPDTDPVTSTVSYRFQMYLSEAGETDFLVILNPTSDRFSFSFADGTPLTFGKNAPEGLTEYNLLRLKVSVNYTDIHTDGVPQSSENVYLPMTNFSEGVYDATDNRRFTVEKSGTSTVSLQVSRLVNKVEVWFRSSDLLNTDPNIPSLCTRVVSQTMYDPTTAYAPLFNYTGIGSQPAMYFADNNSTTRESETRRVTLDRAFDYTAYSGTTGFPEYTGGVIEQGNTEYYSDRYFVKIGEYYVLPNRQSVTSSDGSAPGGTGLTRFTRLSLTYAQVLGTYSSASSSWQWQQDIPTTFSKTIYLPSRCRNATFRVWCDFRDAGDSFFYTVQNWEEMTVDVPAFE